MEADKVVRAFLKLATESQAWMCCGRLFHSLIVLGKKEWRWESTEEWGRWNLTLLDLVALPRGMRSSRGMSMSPDLALNKVASLLLALRSARGGQPRDVRFLFELPWVKE